MWLVTVRPVGGNLPFELHTGQFTIGRSADCEIVVQDATISRAHARLVVRAGGEMQLVDLHSRNGVYANGRPISTAAISAGDVIRLGAIDCQISTGPTLLLPEAEDEAPTLPFDKQRQGLGNWQPAVPLSPRKREVVELILKGLDEEQIARRLCRSFHTVHNHLRAIYRTFNVHSRPELIAKLLGTENQGEP